MKLQKAQHEAIKLQKAPLEAVQLQRVQLEAMKLQEVQLERSRVRAAWTPRAQRRPLPCAGPTALPSMMWTTTTLLALLQTLNRLSS